MILNKFVEAYQNNLNKAFESGYENNETTQKAVFTITARMFHNSDDKELVHTVFELNGVLK